MSQELEVWQRGALPNLITLLQPVAHALLQASEEVELYMKDFPNELLWVRPADLASPGFHLQHLTGVLDRVFTYARGEKLSGVQFEELYQEGKDTLDGLHADLLVGKFIVQVKIAIEQLRNTPEAILTEYRGVGREGLPSTVIGLFVHGAEHTMRHVGQLMVTMKIIQS
jgi:hypothetical protein